MSTIRQYEANTRPVKILFLDIDGVLNSKQFLSTVGVPPHIDPHANIDPLAIERVNAILSLTNARIVLSTAWRVRFGRLRLTTILEERGLLPGNVVGCTPYIPLVERRAEIAHWLGRNPGVESYAVIDDDPEARLIQTRFVQTNEKVGITWADVAKLEEILSLGCRGGIGEIEEIP